MVFLAGHTPVDRRYLATLDHSPERAQLELFVRSEAIAAGRRQGRHGIQVPEAVLNFIVATSDWTMSREQLSARAAQIAEHYADNQPPFNFHTATRAQIYAYFAGMGRLFGTGCDGEAM